MASTNTHTQTETYSRIRTIRNQFRQAFTRIMGYSELSYKKYLDAIDKKDIQSISFWAYTYGSDGVKEKWYELVLSVDWNKHEQLLSSGKGTVVLKKVWNGSLTETSAAIDDFNEFVSENSLKVNFSVSFSNSLSTSQYNSYMKSLGLVKGSPTRWIDEKTPIGRVTPKLLEEYSLDLYCRK